MHVKISLARYQPDHSARLRRALLGAVALWVAGLPGGVTAEPPRVIPVETQRIKSAIAGKDAFSIEVMVDGESYRLLLDEAAGVTTLAGGDEPEVGKRSHMVRPLRTVTSAGKLLLDVEVDGTTVRVPLGIEAADNGRKTPPAPARPRRDPVVWGIQEGLAKLGFDPGPADGLPGRQTRIAMQRFEKRSGIALADPPTAADLAIVRWFLAKSAAEEPPVPATRPEPPASSKTPAPAAEAREARAPEPSPPPVAEAAVPASAAVPATAAPAPPASSAGPEPTLDLDDYAREPYTLESRKTVEAIAEQPDAAPAALERMVGVLLVHGRLDEARALADDILRRYGPRSRLGLLREAVTALTTGALAPDAALTRVGNGLWSTIAALYRGDLDRAASLGERAAELGALPDALRRKVAFDALARFVEARRFAPAHDAMRMIESWTAEPDAMDELAYWQGRELELKGEPAAAATLYGRLTGRPDAIGIRARYRLAGIRLADADPATAARIADELQYLAANWVEPQLDPEHERLIAKALRKSGRVLDAIEQLRRWGAAPEASQAAVRAETVALLAGLADGSVPVTEPLRCAVLSMADRLAPDDPAGRTQIVAAARRLADAGLEERADAMLEAIEERGDTAEQIEVRLQRAALAIEGGDPQRALRVLRTMTAMVAPSSPERARWAMLSARALIDAGEPAAAKHLIEGERMAAGDGAAKAALFEAALATGDWAWIAEQMRKALPADPAKAARDDPGLRDNLLGLAAALNNAGRVAEAVALGRTWGPVLAETPEAALFEALTRPEPQTVEELQKTATVLLAAVRGGS
ncbi:hypothetical protein [Benzoatithermus flavus]|uniref:Peptidoglycan binding-like domain-containing protein n=1 Tax=Benzoatithermus flavus TaxID=3108223 RepID=A0ABU8XUW4_9PROT